LYGVFALAVSVLFFWIFVLTGNSGPPPKKRLQTVEGVVQDVWPSRSDVVFRFSERAKTFKYLSLEGSLPSVKRAIVPGRHLAVQVDEVDLRDPSVRTVLVFVVSAGGREIRSYEDVSEHWKGNDRTGWLAVAIVFSISVMCFLTAWHEREKQGRRSGR
jgi:hypothetical protein